MFHLRVQIFGILRIFTYACLPLFVFQGKRFIRNHVWKTSNIVDIVVLISLHLSRSLQPLLGKIVWNITYKLSKVWIFGIKVTSDEARSQIQDLCPVPDSYWYLNPCNPWVPGWNIVTFRKIIFSYAENLSTPKSSLCDQVFLGFTFWNMATT